MGLFLVWAFAPLFIHCGQPIPRTKVTFRDRFERREDRSDNIMHLMDTILAPYLYIMHYIPRMVQTLICFIKVNSTRRKIGDL